MSTERQDSSGNEYAAVGEYTDGAIHVNVTANGPTGAAHNRNINDAVTTHPGNDTTNTATWTAAEGVTELTITSINSSGTGSANQNDEGYLVVINAPTAAIALAWLTDAGAVGQDIVYEGGITAGEPLIIRRTTAITRIDVLPLNIDQRFVIGAV